MLHHEDMVNYKRSVARGWVIARRRKVKFFQQFRREIRLPDICKEAEWNSLVLELMPLKRASLWLNLLVAEYKCPRDAREMVLVDGSGALKYGEQIHQGESHRALSMLHREGAQAGLLFKAFFGNK